MGLFNRNRWPNRFEAPEEKLCKVLHIYGARRPAAEIEINYTDFWVTLEDPNGARGKINLGIIAYDSPWVKLRTGDQVLAEVKKKELFPLEMKILKPKEIYHVDEEEPVVLAA